jgi:hypothetical protein
VWCEGDDPRPRARITARLDLRTSGHETSTTHNAEDVVAVLEDWLARFSAEAAAAAGHLDA